MYTALPVILYVCGHMGDPISGTLVPSGSPVVFLQLALCCLIIMACDLRSNKLKQKKQKQQFNNPIDGQLKV